MEEVPPHREVASDFELGVMYWSFEYEYEYEEKDE